MSKYDWTESVMWTIVSLFGAVMMFSVGKWIVATMFLFFAIAFIPSRYFRK